VNMLNVALSAVALLIVLTTGRAQVRVRLVDGPSSDEGRLEVYYNGTWGTVCDDEFDDTDASVACYMLGYAYSGLSIGNHYGAGGGTIWLDNVRCVGWEMSIASCRHNGWGRHNCRHSDDVSVSCIPVRLAGGSSPHEGRLEVRYNGTWGTVCDNSFDDRDARVVCYMLGYGRAGQYIGNRYGAGSGPIWLDNVHCSEWETQTSIAGCGHNGWGNHRCDHSEDVSVSCITVRLVGGSSPREGRLEVHYNGTWGTVCEDYFDDRDASVACHTLGYGHAGRYIGNRYGAGSGPIWLANVRCSRYSSYRSITDCSHNGWGRHICIHNEDVSVSCHTVTLVGRSDGQEGRLEVYHNGTWGTVCDNGFTDAAAGVVCYMLGYGHVGRFIGNRYGAGSGQIWLDNLQCNGTETNITDCQHSGWGSHDCQHSQDVSVSCITVRLVGGPSPREGRLEVRYNGIWGTVCSDYFDDTDASVVCYMLGYGGTGRYIGNRYGAGSGPIWLDNVRCYSDRSYRSITDCSHNGWGRHNCNHTKDVSILCTTVRLVGGSDPQEGRLQVYHDGTWGTACDNGFTDTAAGVVCYMIGYGHVGRYIYNRYGAGSGQIWLDSVQCSGTETNITDCQHRGWGRHDCGHNEDVSISCFNQLRLVGELGSKGRLEVYHNGTWGTVCDNGFNDAAARVVCYSLGYGYTGRFIKNAYGAGSGQTWLDNVRCNGRESHITKCRHNGWGPHNCSHDDDVSVSCIIDSAEAVVLVGGGDPRVGRLEVFHGTQWGTVCDDGFTDAAARVVCFSLGFGYVGRKVDINRYGVGDGLIWFDNVTCSGSEQHIGECSHSDWTVHRCSHHNDVAVSCISNRSAANESDSTAPVTPVRLVGGSNSTGRLEVLHNGVWGTVCGDFFTVTEARVICRMFGFSLGSKVDNSNYTTNDGPIWLDKLQCNGTERDVAECSHNGWGVHNCQHREDVAVSCADTKVEVRLNGGRDPREGRLEVFYNGTWEFLYEYWDRYKNGLNDASARDVCNMLGFGYTEGRTYGKYTKVPGSFWLNYAACHGTEKRFDECIHSIYERTHRCCGADIAYVSCLAEGAVALSGGESPREGRLEVYHDGSWGTVCDDRFNDAAARVVCFSLGFGYVGRETNIDKYGVGVGTIWLDDVECSGTERDISECSHRWGDHNCAHNEDVAVSCVANSPASSNTSTVPPTSSTRSGIFSTSAKRSPTSTSVASTTSMQSGSSHATSTSPLTYRVGSTASTTSSMLHTSSRSSQMSTVSFPMSRSSPKSNTTWTSSPRLPVRSPTSASSPTHQVRATASTSSPPSSTASSSSSSSTVASARSTQSGSSHTTADITQIIIVAIIVCGLIVCVLIVIIGIIAYKCYKTAVHSRKNPQREPTETAMVPMSVTSSAQH